MVQRNLTWGDATFRGLTGLVLIILGLDALILFDGGLRWAVASSAFAMALALEATAASGHCPIYAAFGRVRAPKNNGWKE